MTEDACCQAKDWVGDARSYALAWGLPAVALVATAFAPPPIRTAAWLVSLVWMGAACLANARRCGRSGRHAQRPTRGQSDEFRQRLCLGRIRPQLSRARSEASRAWAALREEKARPQKARPLPARGEDKLGLNGLILVA
jgi:hypothetical protein